MENSIVFPGFILHPDGSFVRQPLPTIPANPDFIDGVASKDVTIDRELNLWARVYTPQTNAKLLPVVIYYHGGGFVLFSADFPDLHKLARNLCKKLSAIIVSVNYRLAPEHRLPAAYEDGLAAVKWLQDGASEFQVDLSRVFLIGDSAGGNLAHHVALYAKNMNLQLAGQIHIQPFFGGVSRTSSDYNVGGFLSNEMADIFWSLSLPENADRDHGFCNVSDQLGKSPSGLNIPRTLVVVGGKDHLLDRQIEYVEVLRELGIDVELVKYENVDHAFYFDSKCEETVKLLDDISAFVNK